MSAADLILSQDCWLEQKMGRSSTYSSDCLDAAL